MASSERPNGREADMTEVYHGRRTTSLPWPG